VAESLTVASIASNHFMCPSKPRRHMPSFRIRQASDMIATGTAVQQSRVLGAGPVVRIFTALQAAQ